MAYKRVNKPEGSLFHYTKRGNLEQILKDQKIKRFHDRECWFCTSIEDIMRLMELTVMQEGKPYYDVKGHLQRYPAFVAEDYVILELCPRFQSGEWVKWSQELPRDAPRKLWILGDEFSNLKLGFRGDLKFYPNPTVYEVSTLIERYEAVFGLQME